MLRAIHLPLLAIALALIAATASAQPAVVVLVRHAEKAAQPADDPGLTPEGEARARALAEALAGARIDAVVTTHLRRTRLTAAPAAGGRAPIVVRAGGDAGAHARAVADSVLARPAGQTVLVVGHSNTIPAIIAALGGPELPDLCDGEYATLFVLAAPGSGRASLIRARYGAADPPGAEGCGRTMRQ
jgi:broad specificity phosphatase PhoE